MHTDVPATVPQSVSAPLDPVTVTRGLLDEGFGPFLGVPCSVLGPMITVLQSGYPDEYLITANEGEAVAIAAGAHLAGRRPVVLMQNSGLGNAVNPLTSLCHTLRIPVLLLITWRGGPGSADEPQHRLMGAITTGLLTAMQVHHEVLPLVQEEVVPALRRARTHLTEVGLPYAFVVPRGALRQPGRKPRDQRDDGHMLRAEAIGEVVRTAGPAACYVATTGKTARELERDWDAPNNLYVVGSMGCASSVGLGIALGTPDRQIVVLDGDGAALMRLEAMATIGRLCPANLTHVILDNEAYESTGGQPTGSAAVDLCGIALACGYRTGAEVRDARGIADAVTRGRGSPGPHLIRIRIRPGSDPALGRPSITPPDARARFMAGLAHARREEART
jgi:phosphonopyruvate decarboxylase